MTSTVGSSAPQLAAYTSVMCASGGWHATVLSLLQAAAAMAMHSEMYWSAMHPRPALLRSAGSLLAALLPLISATRSLAGFPAAGAFGSQIKGKWNGNLPSRSI